jgi:stress-induced morphogen
MPRKIRGAADGSVTRVLDTLARYEAAHPRAEIEVYRRNSASVRIRIIDPDFAGMDRAARHNHVWDLLDELPEDVQSQISVLLLLTPEETGKSLANQDFDHPIPSQL